jgi:hypothetical protein
MDGVAPERKGSPGADCRSALKTVAGLTFHLRGAFNGGPNWRNAHRRRDAYQSRRAAEQRHQERDPCDVFKGLIRQSDPIVSIGKGANRSLPVSETRAAHTPRIALARTMIDHQAKGRLRTITW